MLPKVLNHMCCPRMRHDDFLRMAKRIGCIGVHYRNDLVPPLFDGVSPESVAKLALNEGMRITGLAQLERFNDWNSERAEEAKILIELAKAIGAAGIGLIPVNDGIVQSDTEQTSELEFALTQLKPMLDAAGLQGFIEPLGFSGCSLRHKSDAVAAIEAVEGRGTFMLVHDTFHHYLANEQALGAPIFPEYTAIVEISGVVEPELTPLEMEDKHRVLVDARDRIGNVGQIRELIEAGFAGPVSFEPFSPQVHNLIDPASEIAQSFDFIARELAA